MCQSARYDRCIRYVSVTVYALALSSDSEFPGIAPQILCNKIKCLKLEFKTE
jgi:hypothetical protein